jgi:hypothetical protein
MSKVRVLFLVSNPSEEDRLAVDEESRLIAAKIRSTEHRDAIELITAWAVRPDDLQQLLLQHRPHVVHFSGHGMRDAPIGDDPAGARPAQRDMRVAPRATAEHLMLTGEGGRVQLLSKAVLVHLFRVLRGEVHLVLLSACHTEPIAEALVEVIPSAIGMCGSISDPAAIAFATAFYQALGYRRSIREAFDLGRNALMNLPMPEDHTLGSSLARAVPTSPRWCSSDRRPRAHEREVGRRREPRVNANLRLMATKTSCMRCGTASMRACKTRSRWPIIRSAGKEGRG